MTRVITYHSLCIIIIIITQRSRDMIKNTDLLLLTDALADNKAELSSSFSFCSVSISDSSCFI